MIRYYIWLQQALEAGNNRFAKAIEHFGSPEAIFKADETDRIKSGVFTKKDLLGLNSATIVDALEIISKSRAEGIEIIPYSSKKYPICLSAISNPPIVLYVKGKMPDFDNTPAVTIVGPRKVSEFGKKAAFSLGYRLAASGITVVSGGAVGADTYAHAGALKSGGKTVLCLACGICSDYLPENKKLREAVANSGCLITEYPPEWQVSKYNFPVRNRIMSALGLGTVVIEAGVRSGSLITARHALEQGRDVFVIPGSPSDKKYSGSNALLRDGAKPILDASDIFNEYIPLFPDKINIEKAYEKPIIEPKTEIKNEEKSEIEEKNENFEKNSLKTLSKEAKIVYNYLDKQKFLPEDISGCGIDGDSIISALTELEMEMLIKAIPGGMYEKL